LAQKLAGEDNRLVVTASTVSGLDTAEVVHEALIRGWPTLVDWVRGDRAFLFWRHQLKPRLDDWRTDPMDEGAFLRGRPLAVAQEWVAKRASEINEDEKVFIASSARAIYKEKRVTLELTKKRLAHLKDVLASTQYNLITITEGRVLHVFHGLLKHFFYSYIFVVIMTIFQLGETYNNIQSLLGVLPSDIAGGLFPAAVVVGLTILLPMILRYLSFGQRWNSKGQLALQGSTLWFALLDLIKINQANYYISLGLISYITNVIVASLILWPERDVNIMYTLMIIGISFLYAGLYTVILAVILDRHILSYQSTRVSNRVFDGLVTAVPIVTIQMMQFVFMTRLLHHETRLEIVLISNLNTTVCSFAAGMYVLVSTSRKFIQAKSILDECSAHERVLR
jgi:hypothetical protein